MTQEQIEKTLGRKLTATETANFDAFMGIAYAKAKSLLCIDLCIEGATRVYPLREGYSELAIDPFYSVVSVKVNGKETEDYVKTQNGEYNSDWYDTLQFGKKIGKGTAEIKAAWGFNGCMPADLKAFIANLFDSVTKSQKTDSRVKSKKIEDFSVTYGDMTVDQAFVADNALVIGKYGRCNLSQIRNGRICPVC